MVIGVGVDIVEVSRLSSALEGTKTMETRVFTEREISYCHARKNKFQHLSGRFAAKEAALKALGTGWSQGIQWKDVEIVNDDSGRPALHFSGKAKEVFDQSGASHSLVTITHSAQQAIAVVILEK
jgi:holo-[acyl-carrier protein] synthase